MDKWPQLSVQHKTDRMPKNASCKRWDTFSKHGRFRRCGNGQENVSFHHSSPCENRVGGDHGPRLPSRPLVPPQHHVGALTRSLPKVLKCCGVAQRQPGVADAMIEALINARHKCTKKMQWTPEGAHHVLQIRALMASDEWESKGQDAVLLALGAVA